MKEGKLISQFRVSGMVGGSVSITAAELVLDGDAEAFWVPGGLLWLCGPEDEVPEDAGAEHISWSEGERIVLGDAELREVMVMGECRVLVSSARLQQRVNVVAAQGGSLHLREDTPGSPCPLQRLLVTCEDGCTVRLERLQVRDALLLNTFESAHTFVNRCVVGGTLDSEASGTAQVFMGKSWAGGCTVQGRDTSFLSLPRGRISTVSLELSDSAEVRAPLGADYGEVVLDCTGCSTVEMPCAVKHVTGSASGCTNARFMGGEVEHSRLTILQTAEVFHGTPEKRKRIATTLPFLFDF